MFIKVNNIKYSEKTFTLINTHLGGGAIPTGTLKHRPEKYNYIYFHIPILLHSAEGRMQWVNMAKLTEIIKCSIPNTTHLK